MNLPENLKYTKDHEWAILNEDGLVVIGITDYAQTELGEIVFVEIETVDEHIEQNGIFGTVEAVKVVSELFMPINGTVVEVNEALADAPELINEDPYDKGWMVKIKPDSPDDLDGLLSAAAYGELVGA